MADMIGHKSIACEADKLVGRFRRVRLGNVEDEPPFDNIETSNNPNPIGEWGAIKVDTSYTLLRLIVPKSTITSAQHAYPPVQASATQPGA